MCDRSGTDEGLVKARGGARAAGAHRAAGAVPHAAEAVEFLTLSISSPRLRTFFTRAG
jgi:hypothetical protein